jgi:hypothetical protein
MFVPSRKHQPPLSATGTALLYLYVDDVRTSEEAPASTVCYNTALLYLHAVFSRSRLGFKRDLFSFEMTILY